MKHLLIKKKKKRVQLVYKSNGFIHSSSIMFYNMIIERTPNKNNADTVTGVYNATVSTCSSPQASPDTSCFIGKCWADRFFYVFELLWFQHTYRFLGEKLVTVDVTTAARTGPLPHPHPHPHPHRSVITSFTNISHHICSSTPFSQHNKQNISL